MSSVEAPRKKKTLEDHTLALELVLGRGVFACLSGQRPFSSDPRQERAPPRLDKLPCHADGQGRAWLPLRRGLRRPHGPPGTLRREHVVFICARVRQVRCVVRFLPAVWQGGLRPAVQAVVVQPPHRAMAPVPLTHHPKYYTTVPSFDSPWLFAMRGISDGRRAIGRAGTRTPGQAAPGKEKRPI